MAPYLLWSFGVARKGGARKYKKHFSPPPASGRIQAESRFERLFLSLGRALWFVFSLRQIRARKLLLFLRGFWIAERLRGVGGDFLSSGHGSPRV